MVTALGTATALGLGACTSGGSPGGPGASGAPAATSAACSVDDPPTSSAASPATIPPVRARGKVGVLLPDNGRQRRPAHEDGTLLTAALEQAGLTPEVRYAPGEDAFLSAARDLIGDGVAVLVLGAADAAWSGRAEQVADLAGVEVIDYGGLSLGGTAPYVVSFDYEEIGRLQARTMISCLESRGVTRPRIILVDGGTDVDENAVLLAIGAHQVLDPLVSGGRIEIDQETTARKWSTDRAAAAFRAALEASDDKVDGVLVADDGLAGAVIGVLHSRELDATVVAGSGSGTEGLRRVVTGEQSLTVHEDLALQADATARLAAALVAGTGRAVAGVPLSPFADPLAPGRGLRALFVPAQVVTQGNVGDVVETAALPTGELCAGISDQCSALGVE